MNKFSHWFPGWWWQLTSSIWHVGQVVLPSKRRRTEDAAVGDPENEAGVTKSLRPCHETMMAKQLMEPLLQSQDWWMLLITFDIFWYIHDNMDDLQYLVCPVQKDTFIPSLQPQSNSNPSTPCVDLADPQTWWSVKFLFEGYGRRGVTRGRGGEGFEPDQGSQWKISWTNQHPGWFIGGLNPNKW